MFGRVWCVCWVMGGVRVGACVVCVEACVLGHGGCGGVCGIVCGACVGRVWGVGAAGERVYRSLRFIIRIPW